MRCCQDYALKFTLLLILSSAIQAAEPPATEKLKKEPTDYAAVVAQLVSPNQAAEINKRDESVRFPAGYDKAAQEKIDAARKQLHDNFEAALPHLAAALEDERYSLTIALPERAGYFNRSVGGICDEIISSQLEVYREKLHCYDDRRWVRYSFPVSKEWYAKHQGQSLVELQLDAIDWAIEKRKVEENIYREDKNELAELMKLREELKKSGQPLKPSGLQRMTTRDSGN